MAIKQRGYAASGCVAVLMIVGLAVQLQGQSGQKNAPQESAPEKNAPVTQSDPASLPLDRSKMVLEWPVKQALKQRQLAQPPRLYPELAGAAVAGNASSDPSPPEAHASPANDATVASGSLATETNPTVEPGKIVWHDDFQAACKASQRSGKPVLLFQLLGRLDQRFT